MIHNKIEDLLLPYKALIGSDYVHYKNHVHRVFNYTMELKKAVKDNDDQKIAIAAVFHDIGMWTAKTFDYLDPSISKAVHYLKEINRREWIEEIALIIDMHHKLSGYSGKFSDNVEAFRKADLVDLTKGLKRFGLPRDLIAKNHAEFPMGRFRKIILSKFTKYFLRHPFSPLPMFKN